MSIDQGGPKRHALGVDFGTSNTVAVARWPDGRARTILVDGSPLLPSAVYAEPDGTINVGRDAVHSARLDPARYEPNPKRRIDDGLVLLGDREIAVVDLIAAVLARVAEEWHRAVGPVRPDVTLTCPATWGATRRTLLAEAAARAGLEGARLVAEPVAAATYFAEVLGRDVPIGSVVVVHDFGAGTFDASVVARTADGFEVLAVDGRDDIGGLDVDAAIVEHLRTDAWQRLMEPATIEERRAQRQLWDDVRIAKERLSRSQSADFVVPLLDVEAHLTRDELERVARPVLEQTVRITKGLLNWADLPAGRLAGVFLVGGASRIPLVATLLHRELGEAPVVIEQPELVVAEGSILADAALLATGPAAPGPTAELRLVSTGRAETAIVRVAAAPIPGITGLQPAVDPWANFAVPEWTPDPEATVATTPPPYIRPPGGAAGPMASGQVLSGQISSDPVSGGPTSDRSAATQPVSDRSAATRPVSDRSAATRPVHDRSAATRPVSGGAARGSVAAVGGRPVSPAHPVPVIGRPFSPASPPGQTGGKNTGKNAGKSAGKNTGKSADKNGGKTVRQARPAPPVKRKRRTNSFVRALQIMLSIIVMIAVPIAALVLAYGYGNGDSLQDDAVDVFRDIADLIGIG